jgi:hypothetical protein
VIDWAAKTQPGKEDTEPQYEDRSKPDFQEEVTLPPTWLFTCSENDIEVVTDATE